MPGTLLGTAAGALEPPRRLGDLYTEVAHTDTEIRQTLGVIEERREGAVAVDERPQVGGQDGLPGQQEPDFLRRVLKRRQRGRCEALQLTGQSRNRLRQRGLRGARRGARRGSDRGGLGGLGGRAGGLWCRGKRRHLGRRRRLTRIAVHRRGVLGPHLAVLGFQLRNNPVVLTQHVGRHRLGQLGAVGRDQRRRHHRGQRGLVGSRGRLSLGGRLLGLSGGGRHPRHIRLHRCGHRRRGRPQPLLAGQGGDHFVIAQGSRIQLGGEPIPGRGRRHQRRRARTGINPSGVDLRR